MILGAVPINNKTTRICKAVLGYHYQYVQLQNRKLCVSCRDTFISCSESVVFGGTGLEQRDGCLDRTDGDMGQILNTEPEALLRVTLGTSIPGSFLRENEPRMERGAMVGAVSIFMYTELTV
jgi:hypothetical protein